ncbi:MAG: hypothetical protein F4W90_09130 [Gammaproteobacteria bacterium]|nr:hypothetical protein [Gammaproteobacteria bacterium]
MDRAAIGSSPVAGQVSWDLAINGPPADYKYFPEVRAGINASPLPQRIGPEITITDKQKTSFYHDGFLIIKHAVPLDLTREARVRVEGLRDRGGTTEFQRGFQFFATSPECQQAFVNMFEGSQLGACLRELIGPFSPIIACDAHNTPGADDSGFVGGDQGEMGHIDGMMAPPPEFYPANRDDIIALGKDPDDPEAMHRYMSHLNHTIQNPMGTPFYMDPEQTLTIGDFTAFVGIAFSDQTVIGSGQTGVRRGFHHDMEQFFRMQREAGGPIGYEGPGWPRVEPISAAHGQPHMGMPTPLLQPPGPRHGGSVHIDGWRDSRGNPYTWLTPVSLEEGDAFIALHGLPHAGTANHSRRTRYAAFYRVRRFRSQNPYEGDPRWMHGTRDHNDRLGDASAAKFDYDTYNPYAMTIDHLCDMWSEWDGMQEIVNSERDKQGGRYPVRLEFPQSEHYSLGRLRPVEKPQEGWR